MSALDDGLLTASEVAQLNLNAEWVLLSACNTAATAEEGIALAERLAPDLVLLDLKLPGMGGLEALKQLRSRHPEIKIILVTAHGNIQIAVEAMKAGAWTI